MKNGQSPCGLVWPVWLTQESAGLQGRDRSQSDRFPHNAKTTRRRWLVPGLNVDSSQMDTDLTPFFRTAMAGERIRPEV